MPSIYIKNELKKLLLATFREIFAQDPDFPYNKSDIVKSSIIISTRYATPKTEALTPQIIVNVGSYGASQSSFYRNFYKEVPGSVTGTITKRQFTNLVEFQFTVDILSSVKEECEYLTDKIFNILHHEYAELILKLGLNIQSVAVGDVVPREQYPQYSFTSSVSSTGALRLEWTIGKLNDQEDLLKNISLTVKSLTQADL